MSLQRSKAIQEFSVGEETKALLVVIVEDDEGSSHQKVQCNKLLGVMCDYLSSSMILVS